MQDNAQRSHRLQPSKVLGLFSYLTLLTLALAGPTAAVAAGPPWSFSAGLSNYQCNEDSSFSFTLDQQTNSSSLKWTATVSLNNYFIPNDLNYSVRDQSGTLLSNSTKNAGTVQVTASRAPVGTPTLYLNGQLVNSLSGCETSVNDTVTGVN